MLKYKDTIFKIAKVIDKIDSYKFFYGCSGYKDIKETKKLFLKNKINLSYSHELDVPSAGDKDYKDYHKISTKGLSFLCRFLGKLNFMENKSLSNYPFFIRISDFKFTTKIIIDDILSGSEFDDFTGQY